MVNRLFICVDMQKDFVDGVLGTPEAQEIVPKINEFLHKIEHERLLYTMDTHDTNYLNTHEGKKLPIPHCIKYSEGWSLAVDNVKGNRFFIEKDTFCYNGWKDSLRNYFGSESTDIYIYLFGLDTDICVISNALALKTLYPAAEIYIIEDLTAGSTPENKEAALKVAKACQINVINSEEIK